MKLFAINSRAKQEAEKKKHVVSNLKKGCNLYFKFFFYTIYTATTNDSTIEWYEL